MTHASQCVLGGSAPTGAGSGGIPAKRSRIRIQSSSRVQSGVATKRVREGSSHGFGKKTVIICSPRPFHMRRPQTDCRPHVRQRDGNAVDAGEDAIQELLC